MKIIFKYILDVTPTQVIKMPFSHQILTVQIQHGIPVMWVMVDDTTIMTSFTILCHGTGQEIPFTLEGVGIGHQQYIGTVQMREGMRIWHYFKLT